MLQLLDPFNLTLEAVADVDSETRVFGIEDVSFGAALEGVGVSFDQIFKPVDPGVELSYFGDMVILSLFNSFEEGLGCRDSLLYEQWATTRDLSWMRLMKSRRCVMVMRSKLRRTKATMWEGSSVVGVDKRIV